MFKLDKQAKTLTIGKKVYNEQDITLNHFDNTTEVIKGYDIGLDIKPLEGIHIVGIQAEIDNHLMFIDMISKALLLEPKSKILQSMGYVISEHGEKLSKELDSIIETVLKRNNIDDKLFDGCDMQVDYKINKIYIVGGNE